MMIVLLVDGRPKKTSASKGSVDLTGIVNESFTQAAGDNAMIAQQTELESLKKQISELTNNIKTMGDEHQKQMQAQKEELTSQLTTMVLDSQKNKMKRPRDNSSE